MSKKEINEDNQIELIKMTEEISESLLDEIKGGANETASEKCCDIQLSCNNKTGKPESTSEVDLAVQ